MSASGCQSPCCESLRHGRSGNCRHWWPRLRNMYLQHVADASLGMLLTMTIPWFKLSPSASVVPSMPSCLALQGRLVRRQESCESAIHAITKPATSPSSLLRRTPRAPHSGLELGRMNDLSKEHTIKPPACTNETTKCTRCKKQRCGQEGPERQSWHRHEPPCGPIYSAFTHHSYAYLCRFGTS